MLAHFGVKRAPQPAPSRKLIGTMLGTAALAGLFGLIWHAINSGTVDERVQRLQQEAENLQREREAVIMELANATDETAPEVERRLADIDNEIQRLHDEAQDYIAP